VQAFADDVSVLRRGRLAWSGAVANTSAPDLAAHMVGGAAAAEGAEGAEAASPAPGAATGPAPTPARNAVARLQITGLCVAGDRGERAVDGLDLEVHAGEIVGVAGVSGNGQRELMQALVGQRDRLAGQVRVEGQPFAATRTQNRDLRVRSLPEEPLLNACVPGMSVAENMALRRFDEPPYARAGWRRPGAVRQRARELVQAFRVRTRSERTPIRALSGGNVQRAVLARELADDAALLLVSNPSFGLDFSAVAEVHQRLDQARRQGAAVLMVGEDLDELLQLADRIVVMSHGRIVHACRAQGADRLEIGRHMGGSSVPAAPHHPHKARP
jgi:simple sugar transport system ATP-binding protein